MKLGETRHDAVITVRGLTNRFGEQAVHEDLDLDVQRGEILGVVGGSGTGKSVLMRSIIGLQTPQAGEVTVFGEAMIGREESAARDVRRRWGVLFQGGALFSTLTVAENVEVPIREYYPKLDKVLLDEIAAYKVAMTGLGPEAAPKYPSELSGGMRKRAGLARALALDPELLFLDEPTAGLDPIGAAAFDDLIKSLKDTLGLTVFLITHDLDTLYAICDRVAVLADRKVIAIGTIPELLALDHPWIQEYFNGPRGRAASDASERDAESDPDERRRRDAALASADPAAAGATDGSGAGHDALMENRSNHILVGGVVLALIVVTLAFLVWIAGFSGKREQHYDIFFKTGVAGLNKGAAITFSGVPVGTVEEIALMPQSPEFVRVRISVKEGVPILQGTTATIAGVGFTGVSQINLDGAIKGAPPIACPEEGAETACPFGYPVIPTKPGALGELLNSAPQLLEKLSTLTERLGELLDDRNRNSIGNILANVDRLSGALADRGGDIGPLLADTRVAIRQAGEAATKIGDLAQGVNANLGPAMGNLNKAIASAQHSMQTLDATLTDARPGLRTLSTQTVPNANQLIRNLNDMSEALTEVATKLNRGGAGALVGGGKLPDYKPGKN